VTVPAGSGRPCGPSALTLAEHLGDRYTVYRFDRGGRGDSGDTPPWSVAREVEQMRSMPFWPRMVSLAPQLAYDVRLGNGGSVPVDRLAAIDCPTLALAGALSAPWATDGAAAIAAAVPDGRSQIVEGQHHGVDQAVTAAFLAELLGA
jgi:hypothetical protein